MVSGVARASFDRGQTVLRGNLLPWVIASAIVVVGGIAVCSLLALGLLDQQASDCGILFFGTLTGGFVPRAIPAAVELRLDSQGFTVRDILSERFNWDDVAGPFIVTTTLLGDAVCFTRRRRKARGPRFCRATLRNTHGLSPKTLADLLNRRRQEFFRQHDPGD